MAQYTLGILGGDGIGPEVTAEARRCVDAAGEKFGFSASWTEYPFGAEYYLKHNVTLPPSAFDDMAQHNAMLLGAIGDPRIPPGPLEQEIILALRFHYDQYVNLRPAEAFPGIPLPVPLPAGETLDTVIVRENTEDLYMGIGGAGTGKIASSVAAERGLYSLRGRLDAELSGGMDCAYSLGFMTRPAVERVTRYAFTLAKKRGEKSVVVVSKANAVPHLYGFWDAVVRETAAREFPDMEYSTQNVDAICYLLARKPWGWGVLLCPNLFGDIVSDLLSALAGGLGLAAAGNIGDGLSLFEPVHGSAPTIARTGRANPLAAILSASMMLSHLGESAAAAAIVSAVKAYLVSGEPLPVEQGGTAVTAEAGDAVRRRI